MTDLKSGDSEPVNAGELTREDVGDSIAAQAHLPKSGWFEVKAIVRVRAVDESDAINRLSSAIADAKVPGLYPVGEFSARDIEDPIKQARRRFR